MTENNLIPGSEEALALLRIVKSQEKNDDKVVEVSPLALSKSS